MVLNSSVVVAIADLSANLCQYIACNPERLSSDQVLYLIFCLPCRHLGRLADSLWLYLCFNPPDHSLSDYSDDDEGDGSHSD
ncbi:putative adenylsulfate kinase [Hibiscus syriacus]|uniref:Adenylsulfate kinase n=1 Tax=Hibiscus syriacus TaxID=106335 RepID=A0A6A2X0P8_HIBSY|nr:putative adenylsulfate kinase [Hibiscus syriacus]